MLALIGSSSLQGQEAVPPGAPPAKVEGAPEKPAEGQVPAAPVYAALLKDAKTYSGMLTVYQKGINLYAELMGGDYGQDYIVLISIARGIGQAPLLGGFSLSDGDDWVWTFTKLDDRVHVVRKNVRFRATKGLPEYLAVQKAYTDSVLFGLRIIGKGPKGGDLVDLTPVFMSDLPQIGAMLPGFAFAADRSAWAAIKAFDRNMELEVAATYASGGRLPLDTVADTRGISVNVHYSISRLQSTGYQPRLADDRVGYFLTVVKDFSKQNDRDQFVRFINRWHLEKPPGAGDPPYPPKESIKFYIEKTVPYRYRKAVREGIEEWNKAFEKAGWLNAIEVIQQPDDATWDPEDINYNTFRWITSNAGFAMGPSRVNPYTGQILDADVIFDADFLQSWKDEFETFTPQAVAAMTGGPSELMAGRASPAPWNFKSRYPETALCEGMARQMAFGQAAIMAAAPGPQSAAQLEKLIMQGLTEVVMHEVGHTLGLRHNFKGSRLLGLKDLNDPAKTKDAGMVASIMDYNPANIVPKEWQQGDYYPTTLGAYDYWAIEYGYKPLGGGTDGELGELKKIASRSGEPALQYATDEDSDDSDPDPGVNRFDLGADPLEYARARAQIVREVVPGLVDRMTKEGDDFTQVRRALNVLLAEHGQAMYFAARVVGGCDVSRSHRGDKDAKPPFVLWPADKQRGALDLLQEQVFSDKPFQFSPDLYKSLGSTNWNHWGMPSSRRKDYPAHEQISIWQDRILDLLLSPDTLTRMHDNELKTAPAEDLVTTAELVDRLSKAIFSELETVKEGDFSNRSPAIPSLRRNLQRSYLSTLGNLALGRRPAPNDCQTVAYAELASLEAKMRQLLKSNAKLDTYSRAHLEESADRIQKVRDARFTLNSP
jgi:hypothetical protein